MYFISRKCENDHSISLKFIEGRSQLSKGDCLYFAGKGCKLGDLSGAMSCIRLLAVLMCILLMTLLASD